MEAMQAIVRVVMGLIGAVLLYQLGSMVWKLRRCRKKAGVALEFSSGKLREDLMHLYAGVIVFTVSFSLMLVASVMGFPRLFVAGETTVLFFFVLINVLFRRWNTRLSRSMIS